MDVFLDVKGLKKSYKQHEVLKGIDFHMRKGEFLALLGPNGAGKSTTISILCGLMQKDGGTISLNGNKITSQNGESLHQIGVVFQHHCMDEILSGYDNLVLRCGFYHMSYKKAQKRVRELSTLCALDNFINQRVSTLSGGQKRRLDIARALIPNPALLILDEPTTGLDPISRVHIWDMIHHLKKEQQMSVLLTTHYLQEASDADTICILHGGEVVLYGDVNEVCKRFAHDYLYLYADRLEMLERILTKRFVSFTHCKDYIKIVISSTQQSISILQACALILRRFEVIHASLEDVYKGIIKGEKL